jgi:DeoR-like helix-turn-helix domain
MSEDPPLVRQWILLRKLATHRSGLTVREMSREMGVAEKTIRRDLDPTFRTSPDRYLRIIHRSASGSEWRRRSPSRGGLRLTEPNLVHPIKLRQPLSSSPHSA